MAPETQQMVKAAATMAAETKLGGRGDGVGAVRDDATSVNAAAHVSTFVPLSW